MLNKSFFPCVCGEKGLNLHGHGWMGQLKRMCRFQRLWLQSYDFHDSGQEEKHILVDKSQNTLLALNTMHSIVRMVITQQ